MVPRPARRAALALAFAVVAAGSAAAQNHPDSLGWRFVGAAGYVQTSGNSQLSSVTVNDRLEFRPAVRWTLTQTASWVYGKTGGVESADQTLARLRGDFYVSPRLTAYAFLGFEKNRFAGITSRVEEAAGLAWQALRAPRHQLDVEAGASNNQQKSPNTPLDAFFASRVAGRYRFNVTDKAYVEQLGELLSNLEDTGDQRAISTTSLVAPLSAAIGTRVSYLVRYDAEPAETPTPGVYFEKLDTTFSTSLQFTF